MQMLYRLRFCILSGKKGVAMTRIVFLVAVAALVMMGAAGIGTRTAEAHCHDVDVCTTPFAELNASIVSNVPAKFQTSLLTRSAHAQRFIPNDPVRAGVQLQSMCSQLGGLTQGGQVTSEGFWNVKSALDTVLATTPASPCLPPSPILPPNPI